MSELLTCLYDWLFRGPRYRRLVRQADHAKLHMGPDYGTDVSDMSDEEYMALIRKIMDEHADRE